MDQIMNIALEAFSGNAAIIEAIIIAVVAALLTGRIVQLIIFSVLALVVDTFLPAVYDFVENRDVQSALDTAVLIGGDVPGMLPVLGVKLLVYFVVIGILFILKSVLFNRG